MLNTVHFDPWQRSLFVQSVSSANTKEKGPLLAGKEEGTRNLQKHEMSFTYKALELSA